MARPPAGGELIEYFGTRRVERSGVAGLRLKFAVFLLQHSLGGCAQTLLHACCCRCKLPLLLHRAAAEEITDEFNTENRFKIAYLAVSCFVFFMQSPKPQLATDFVRTAFQFCCEKKTKNLKEL